MEREDWVLLEQFGHDLENLANNLDTLACCWEDKTDAATRLPWLEGFRDVTAWVYADARDTERRIVPQPGFDARQWMTTVLIEIQDADTVATTAADPEFHQRYGDGFAQRIRDAAVNLASRAKWVSMTAWLGGPEPMEIGQPRADAGSGQGNESRNFESQRAARHYLQLQDEGKIEDWMTYDHFVMKHAGSYPNLTEGGLRAAVSRERRRPPSARSGSAR